MAFRQLVPRNHIYELIEIEMGYARTILDLQFRLEVGNGKDAVKLELNHLVAELRARKRSAEKIGNVNVMGKPSAALYERLIKFVDKSKKLADEVKKYHEIDQRLHKAEGLQWTAATQVDVMKDMLKKLRKDLKKQFKKVIRKSDILKALLTVESDDPNDDDIIDEFVEKLSTHLRKE